MTALIIIGAVISLLACLLLIPILVDISYKDGEFQARLRYVVMRYNPLPGKEIAESKEKGTKAKRQKKGKEPPEKTRTAKETVQLVWIVLKGSRKGARILRRHLIFSKVRVRIVVGGEDAHSIAESSGKLSVAVLAALDLIGVLFVLRAPKVEITPDFLAAESKYDLSLRVSIRPWYILRAGTSVFFKFMSTLQKDKKLKQQDIKGGKAA